MSIFCSKSDFRRSKSLFSTLGEKCDKEEDRVFTHELFGRKLKGLYFDCWSVGTISYYNLKLGKYRVDYETDSDYVGHGDIDGVELILM